MTFLGVYIYLPSPNGSTDDSIMLFLTAYVTIGITYALYIMDEHIQKKKSFPRWVNILCVLITITLWPAVLLTRIVTPEK